MLGRPVVKGVVLCYGAFLRQSHLILGLALCECRVVPSSSLWGVEAVPRARLYNCLLCGEFK